MLTDSEDKFKSRIDQARRESQTVMKLIAQILPYVRRALKQNHNDHEAKELIRQIELNAFTTSGVSTVADMQQLFGSDGSESEGGLPAQARAMQTRIEQLEEQISEIKEQHQRELMCL